jgi:hypothetical protein
MDSDRRVRLALRALQAGALAVVLAASTYKVFELDRYFVPKEVALHITALLAGLLIARAYGRGRRDRVDTLFIVYLSISALSAIFATNHWLAIRSLTISVSSVTIFWVARTLRDHQLSRPVLSALALAVIAATVTALMQTYGVQTDLFSINRAPGGTLGNRNFVAHIAALGLPIVLLGALQAKNRRAYVLRAFGVTTVLAVLVITRSRAAWLALAGVVVVFMLAMLASRTLRSSGRIWLRLAGMVLLAVIGVAAAVYSPNKLNWNSENPYLESMKGVANYQEGSGRGRLIQYRRSLGMGIEHAMLGVAPGNWAVKYPKHAAPRDPSLNRSEPGTTSNPWPSSDWIAIIAERGYIAAIVLAFVWLAIAWRGVKRALHSTDETDALHGTALVAVLVATFTAGAFDAVAILALPALIFHAAMGALLPHPAIEPDETPRHARTAAMVVFALVAGLGAARSVAQLVGMGIYASTSKAGALQTASMVDPGNYRIHLRLARRGSGLKRSERCKHAKAAHELYPSASAARSLRSGCD